MTGYKSCSDSVLPVADDPGSRSWFLDHREAESILDRMDLKYWIVLLLCAPQKVLWDLLQGHQL